MKKEKTVLIVGAGPVGCVLAERFATQLDWQVHLMDKRPHIAGNCFDSKYSNGVLIHQYGPHYFRTNKKEIINYLSQFTEWIDGNYQVTSLVDGVHYPFPINLKTLELFFKKEKLSPIEAEALLSSIRIENLNPKNSEEFVLSKVGTHLYEAFYLGYTIKQWGIHPRDLSPLVCGRIPIRLNYDNRYVEELYQQMPKNGFTAMFKNMISNNNILLELETEFIKNNGDYSITIYTGPIDAYFNYCEGKLDWRSLEFEYVAMDKEYHQPNVQINYPQDFDFTRSVEIKHVTRQICNQTVVAYEYPKEDGEPYYPIPNDKNQILYEKYKLLAEKETLENHVYFCGRLAEYKYYNTDEVIEKALALFNQIKLKYAHK